jgi:uncharacterized membrane protein
MGVVDEIRLEGPSQSRRLVVHGPVIWALIGLAVIVVGTLLLSLPIVIVGVAVLAGAAAVGYRTRTEVRVRTAHRQGK